MAVVIPGYSVKTGVGGIPIYTPKKPVAPPLKWTPPGTKYTGTMGPGGIPIYTPGAAPVPKPPSDGSVTPVAAPAAPTGSWKIPDYASMLPGDWEVIDAGAQGNKMQGEAEGAFQRSLRQAFIDFGGDSSKIGDYSKYIDDPTLQAARTNKFSAVSQNLAAMTRLMNQNRSRAAAMGMSQSGRSINQAKRALEAKELSDYTAQRQFMSGAEEGTQGLASVRQQIADRLAAARSSAANRLQQSYPGEWVPDQAAAGPATPAGPAALPPVRWGGQDITTRAQLQRALGPGQTLKQWADAHPTAWARLK